MKVAVALLIADLCVSFVYDLVAFPHSLDVGVLVALLYALIAYGKRWAVYIFLVLYVVGLLLFAREYLQLLHGNIAGLVRPVAGEAVATTAVVLLFTRSARSWFAAMKQWSPIVSPPPEA